MADSNIIATLGAAALGAISVILSTYRTASQQQKVAEAKSEVDTRLASEAAIVQERIDIRKGYQERYEALTKEITSLWEMYHQVKSQLNDCENNHREAMSKVADLDRRNKEQAVTILALEVRSEELLRLQKENYRLYRELDKRIEE